MAQSNPQTKSAGILKDRGLKNGRIGLENTVRYFVVEGLRAGSYRVTRSVLPNEVLTTAGDRAVSLSEGSSLNLEFGSYLTDETLARLDTPGRIVVRHSGRFRNGDPRHRHRRRRDPRL